MILTGVAYGILIVGAGLLLYGGYRWWRARASLGWPAAEAALTSAAVEEQQNYDRGGPYVAYGLVVRYDYLVGGKRYSGSTLRFGRADYPTHTDAAEALARLQARTPFQVHYNPRDPTVSIVEPGVGAGVRYFLVISGGIFLTGLWLAMR